MSVDYRQIVVLSANEQCFHRIARLCRGDHPSTAQWLTDPIQLSLMLNTPASTESYGREGKQLMGVVLDLTPTERSSPTTNDHCAVRYADACESQDLELAWAIGSLIAVTTYPSRLPVLLISTNIHLEEMLRLHNAPLVGRISPRDDDLVWHHALARLVADSRTHMSVSAERGGTWAHRADTPAGRVQLNAQVWFDLDECTLLVAGKVIPLTAREAHILTLLTRAPRRYHSATDLAHHLTRPGAFPISEHSIEQSMSGLRRKLGEARSKQSILASRRGLGYTLVTVEMDNSGGPGATLADIHSSDRVSVTVSAWTSGWP